MSDSRINDENAPPSNSNGGSGNNYESLMERINRLKASKVEAPQKSISPSPTETEQGWDQLSSKTGALNENEIQKRFILVQDVKKNETNPKHWLALIQFDLQKWKEDRTAEGLKNLIRLYQKATSTVDLLTFRKTEELCELWIGYAKVLSMTSPTEARETFQYIGTEIGQDSPNYYKSYAAFEVKSMSDVFVIDLEGGNKEKAKNIIAKGLQRRVLTQQHISEFAALSAKDSAKEPPSTPKLPSTSNVPMTPTQPQTEGFTPSIPVTPAPVQSTPSAVTPAPQPATLPVTPLTQPVATADSTKKEDAFKRPAVKKPFGSLGLSGGARRVKVDDSPSTNTDTISPDSSHVPNVLSPQTEEVNMASRPPQVPENMTHPQTYPSKPRTPRANKKSEDESKAEVHSGTIKIQDPATPEAPKLNPQLVTPALLIPAQAVPLPVTVDTTSSSTQSTPTQPSTQPAPTTQTTQTTLPPQVAVPQAQPLVQPSQTSPTLPSSERPPLATYGAPLGNNNSQSRPALKRSSSDVVPASAPTSLPPQPHTQPQGANYSTPLRPAVPASNGTSYGSNTPVQTQAAPVQQQSSRNATPQQRPAVQSGLSYTPQAALPNNSQVAVQQAATSSPQEAPVQAFDIIRQWSDMAFEVNGRLYVKLECVGKGGSSKVYKVMDQELKTYALKRVSLDGAEGASGLVESYLNEISLLKSLRGHKNIIHFVDSEIKQSENVLYMILEFGEIDLARLIQQQGESFNKNYLRVIWQQMLEAVHTVHEERIIHSDLKPANFVFVKGSLKLIDFGIAKAISSDTTNIMRDSTIGTINYMSPEAFININDGSGQQCMKLGRSSDIWSLGCILYQMVYGKTPFAHLTNMYQKVKCIPDPKYPIQYPKINDPLLMDVLKRCLQRDPKKRATIPELLAHPFLNPSELICSQCCKLIQPS